ncbi:hypothetical protein [Litchfieldia salsa]|uniref:Lipoprotein n=1 Tax=Litchfieldia salsa TaxID=930152 RepID=A0A1H0T250_9BACI|nr:hypothetical protein [Litchfieldia salsa]SDP47770.1 hypothetical protein SAMN05216565_103234 [Litchfieldia salsa]
MRYRHFLIAIILIAILASCSRTEIPAEFKDLRPTESNKFYIIGFQSDQSEMELINSNLELFVEDERVVGVTMFYKVDEKSNSILEKYKINNSSGFIVLKNEGNPFYISSYSEFEDNLDQ